MERLTIYETDRGRYTVRPMSWARIWNEKGQIKEALNHLALFIEKEDAEKFVEWKEAEEQGKLLKLPCAVGDTVYVLAECENIPVQLDGTLYGANGELGTATGYYCPYEDNCPFDDEDFEDCEKYKDKTAVFEDTVGDITIGEDGVWIRTVNCGVCSQVGLYIFLTKSAAEQALKEMEGKK